MLIKQSLGGALLVVLIATTTLPAEPPPRCLVEGTCAPAPLDKPGLHPRIGIFGQPFDQNDVTGVLVLKDDQKRDLWFLTPQKKLERARFAPNQDVILKVNDQPVHSSDDILKNTHEEWNKLTILDRKQSSTGEYWVKLSSAT